jgi:hypothetical protein
MRIEIDEDLAAKIKAIATENGISVTKYANNLLEKGLTEDLKNARGSNQSTPRVLVDVTDPRCPCMFSDVPLEVHYIEPSEKGDHSSKFPRYSFNEEGEPVASPESIHVYTYLTDTEVSPSFIDECLKRLKS